MQMDVVANRYGLLHAWSERTIERRAVHRGDGAAARCRASFLESRSYPKSARNATRRSTALTPPPTPDQRMNPTAHRPVIACPHRLLEVTISELAIPDSPPQTSAVLM